MRSFLLILALLGLTSMPATAQPTPPQAPKNPSNTTCEFGESTFYAATCTHANGNSVQLGSSQYGVVGGHANGNGGWLGGEEVGVFGIHFSSVNYGYLGGEEYGAYGQHNNGTYGFLGGEFSGAYAWNNNGNSGFIGGEQYGAYGQNSNGNYGRLGASNYGVYGLGLPWAGYFAGDVHVTGTLTEGAAASKIDHPLDPEGQYLSHSFVESPDMMNVYNGNTTTDAQGFATVTLPDYFEALNRDFRYQLTVIGTFAQAIVAEEIEGNRFVIRTDVPNVKVSWQVTGIRKDPWAEAHRIVVEEAKPSEERGYYLHPGLYGQPAERSVEWARDPEGMRAVQEMPQRMEEERRQIEQERQRIQTERERMEAERAQRPPRPDH